MAIINYLIEAIASHENHEEPKLNSNFKKWFGDSIVVNDDGSPKILYHGTNHKFDTFNVASKRGGDLGDGFYFTDNLELAKRIGEYVMPVFISAQATSMDVINARKNNISKIKDINIQPYRDSKQYVVQNPNQIKSIYNNGSWSTTNDNIYE